MARKKVSQTVGVSAGPAGTKAGDAINEANEAGASAGEPTARKVGLALAGGGPGGAIYEIGALRALDEAIDGLDLNHLDIYVGVSAGAFLCAALANQLTTAQMCRALTKSEPGEHPFTPETFFTPAFSELGKRSLTVPRLLFEAVRSHLRNPREQTLKEALTRLSQALPVGVFDNEPIRRYLQRVYERPGRTDDFRKLHQHLVVVATDLDSGEAVRFGDPGMDHIPISRAIQASSALPGLYSPVEIEGRYYADGVLIKTLHASVALEAGAELLVCINPIVPVDTARAVERGIMKRGRLIDRGLPTVLSQTFRTLIHSRLNVGMRRYDTTFRDRDVVLLEPRRDDYRMFFRNIFSFRGRRELCAHAYEATRNELRQRYDELAPIFARHGLTLRRDVLEDETYDLWTNVAGRATAMRSTLPVVDQLDRLLARLELLVDQSAEPEPVAAE